MSRRLVAMGLVAALALGMWLRTRSGLDGDIWFSYDAAFHHRMIERTLAGTLDERDPLRLHPQGARDDELQPTGLYLAAALFHRVAGTLSGNLTASNRLFTSLVGTLTILPVFLLARRLWGSAAAGLVAAFALAVMPAHVSRTASSQLRLDAAGILLVAVHLWVMTLALASRWDRRRTPILAGLAAITLLATLAVWRAAIGLFVTEVLLLAGLWIVPVARRRISACAVGLAAAMLAATALTYARAQDVPVSRGVVPALVIALGIGALGRWKSSASLRTGALLVVGILVIAGALGRAVPATTFDLEEGVATRALLARFGLAGVDPFIARLYGYVDELAMPGPALFVRSDAFSWLGITALIGALTALGLARARRPIGEAPEAPDAASGRAGMATAAWFVACLALIAIVGAMLFQRNKVLAAIPIAVVCGGVARFRLDDLRSGRFPLARSRLRGSRFTSIALTAITTVAIAGAALVSVRRATSLRLDADPATRELCAWLAEHTPSDAGILTDWGDGYLVQTYAGRATATDGHLELAINRRRILERSRALTDSSPSALLELCRETDCDYVLVRVGAHWLPFVYTGAIGDDVARSGRLRFPPGAGATVIGRLLAEPHGVDGLDEVFRAGAFRLFVVAPSG